jgi:hypothetical protein
VRAGDEIWVEVALEPVTAPAAAVVACPGVVAARTATAPVVSAAAAAVALVIVTIRRLASLRWVLEEPARFVCGASS